MNKITPSEEQKFLKGIKEAEEHSRDLEEIFNVAMRRILICVIVIGALAVWAGHK